MKKPHLKIQAHKLGANGIILVGSDKPKGHWSSTGSLQEMRGDAIRCRPD